MNAMHAATLPRDEHAVATENASYRWAYLVLSFGLLLSVAWRGFVRQESAWDLLLLVLLGGLVSAVYRGRHGGLSARWALVSLLAVAIALLMGAALAVIVRT